MVFVKVDTIFMFIVRLLSDLYLERTKEKKAPLQTFKPAHLKFERKQKNLINIY